MSLHLKQYLFFRSVLLQNNQYGGSNNNFIQTNDINNFFPENLAETIYNYINVTYGIQLVKNKPVQTNIETTDTPAQTQVQTPVQTPVQKKLNNRNYIYMYNINQIYVVNILDFLIYGNSIMYKYIIHFILNNGFKYAIISEYIDLGLEQVKVYIKAMEEKNTIKINSFKLISMKNINDNKDEINDKIKNLIKDINKISDMISRSISIEIYLKDDYKKFNEGKINNMAYLFF